VTGSPTDHKDADAAVPAAAYHDGTPANLDGSGFLRGDYATVVSETGNPAHSPTNTFRHTRHQDETAR
jgi:zinc metalloprotease ZmpB